MCKASLYIRNRSEGGHNRDTTTTADGGNEGHQSHTRKNTVG